MNLITKLLNKYKNECLKSGLLNPVNLGAMAGFLALADLARRGLPESHG